MTVRNHMAIIRNLRNVDQSGVSDVHINKLRMAFSHDSWKNSRVLPFRFIAAARHAPKWEPYLEQAMFKCLEGQEKLPGKTVLVIDVSGSMGGALSGNSEMNRFESAAALAILAREICEEVAIYATAGNDHTRIHQTSIVPSRRGFALRDVMRLQMEKLGGGGIFLVQCMDYVFEKEKNADRVFVFTDEQDCDLKLKPESANAFGSYNYLFNVAAYKNGIGYQKWTHIDGFSEHVLEWVRENETQQ